jgi:hypothetical protein
MSRKDSELLNESMRRQQMGDRIFYGIIIAIFLIAATAGVIKGCSNDSDDDSVPVRLQILPNYGDQIKDPYGIST